MTKSAPVLPYHLSQLADLCRAHPTTPKVLFVASRQVGYNLLTSLARYGVGWVNMEAMSPTDHAQQRFEPILRASGLSPLHGDVATVVIADLLRELKDRDPDSYFEPVGVTPSLARSVWETLQALRMAGVKPVDLEAGPVKTEKARALAYLLGRVDEVLRTTRQYDSAYILDFAIREGAGQRLKGMAAVLDETPITRRGLRYLRQSFGDRLVRIGRGEYGLTIPGTVAAHYLSSDPVTGGRIGSAGSIKDRGISEDQAEHVRVFGSKGPDAEIGDVIRYCLEHEIRLDEVEIAYSSTSVYVPQLVDLADRFRLDVSFAEGVPATLTRPGAGLKGFLDWLVGNCQANRLTALMSGGLLSFHRAEDEVRLVDMHGLTAHFRQAVLDEGIERYIPAIERLSASQDRWRTRNGAEVETAFQRRSRLLLKCIDSLIHIVPSGSTFTPKETAALCIDFLTRFSVVHGERDERAVESLSDRFTQYGQQHPTRLPKRLALQLAADMVERHTVQASTARPGSLHAVSIERAAYSGRSHLFVVGLDVDNFPGRAGEDPILLDIEREQLSSNLDLKSTQATDRIWHLVRALGMTTGDVFLGASVFNAEREEALVYPSPFFQSVAKQLGVDYLKPPQLSLQPFHFDDTGILLPQRRRNDYRRFTSSHYPWLQQGAVAAEARRSVMLTEFDGRLDLHRSSPVRAADGTVFSPNRLEKLAACPYRYFLHYVLGVRKPDYYAPDPTRWLDPRDFGTLLHDLFHRFLKELAEEDRRPDFERDSDRIIDLVNEFVELYQKRIPPDNQAAYEYERKRLEASALVFLRTEAIDRDVRPTLFEFVFGSDDAETENLARPLTIRLHDDLEISLRGRIDRVDVLPDGSLAIWDYKTGSSYSFDQGSLLRGGLNLQWVLYAYALEELGPLVGLSGNVARSGYYFASDRENGRQIAERPPSRPALYGVLAPLFSLVEGAAFLHVTKKDGECRFCDFKGVCGTESKTKADLRVMWGPNAEFACLDALSAWMEEE